jgi:PilZ domain
VKRASENERRQHPRFPQLFEMLVRELPATSSQPLNAPSETIEGRVQNVSEGGLCFLSPRPLDKQALVRCEIVVSDLPVHIPTLMQVCWNQKQRVSPETYVCGLKFLL